MQLSLLHRILFTLLLSAIMSGSMTYLISSFYCTPSFEILFPIWPQTWMIAFSMIFIISPVVHKSVAYILK